MVLNQTPLDEHAPVAREYALMAARNLCAGNAAVQNRVGLVTRLRSESAEARDDDLERMGLKVAHDTGAGTFKLVPTEEAVRMVEKAQEAKKKEEQ